MLVRFVKVHFFKFGFHDDALRMGDTQREVECLPAISQIGNGRTQEYIQKLAQDVVSEISRLDPSHSKELLGILVSEVFRAATEQERREKRRQRQAEGIAAAKANGVHFGPSPRTMPDNFETLRQSWRSKELTLRKAAEACGVPKSTFRDAALRVEANR